MRFRARWSLRTLVMGGFGVASLLLMGATGYAIYSIENLASQSERMLAEGVYTMRMIDQLQEQVSDLHRTAQQYQILGTPDLLEIYERRHQRLLDSVAALEAYPWPAAPAAFLAELRFRGETAVAQVRADRQSIDVGEYGELRSLVLDMHMAGQSHMDRALALLRTDVAQLHAALVALALLLTGVAVTFAAAFSKLVSSPIDQIGAGIRGLGRAKFDEPIRVQGPTDLEAIGELLDWLRERLKTLEEQKVTFVRHMSHELKTPLANIREGSELLCEDLEREPNESLREMACIVRDNGVRLQKLIDGLFNFAAWHDDSSTIRAEEFNLAALVNEVVSDYRLDLATHGIRVETALPRQTKFVGDRSRIRSMLDSLLSNAVKYSPPGGTIRVGMEVGQYEVCIDVQDQGPGIPKAQQEKVFLPFFQGQPPASHARARGAGIGLSVARACADAHGGDIAIVAEQGPGAHLQIRLPKRAAADAN
jgi:two-component system, NtrC family, sensor histidine kinase GlrK